MDTPVALIIFNRPLHTEKVFQQIAKIQPRRLFVIADGPRHDHPTDVQRCSDARAIIERVDWKCRVSRKYSDVNLGCGFSQATGLDWVFQQVDQCIVLEDDIVPDKSFFYFCEELLNRYVDDERVMHISGRGVFPDNPSRKYSYYFSSTLSCWGWATWARAWKHFDFKMSTWPEFRDTYWPPDMIDPIRIAHHEESFNYIHRQAPDVTAKDIQWLFACWSQNGLGIRPYRNLVKNIGLEEEATHKCHSDHMKRIDVPLSSISLPLRHPPFVVRDREADTFHLSRFYKALHATQRVYRFREQRRKLRHRIAQFFHRPLRDFISGFLK